MLLARLRQRPCADMRILDPLPQQRVPHWKSGHKICKRKGRVDFRAVQHPAHR
jgi:hypothetical protein